MKEFADASTVHVAKFPPSTFTVIVPFTVCAVPLMSNFPSNVTNSVPLNWESQHYHEFRLDEFIWVPDVPKVEMVSVLLSPEMKKVKNGPALWTILDPCPDEFF